MLTINHTITQLNIESKQQRQTKFLNALLMSLVGLHGFALLFVISAGGSWSAPFMIGAVLALYIAAFFLNRRGYTRLAAHLACYIFTLEFFAYFVGNLLTKGLTGSVMMAVIMTLAILIAGMVISRQAIIWFAILDTVLIGLTSLLVAGIEALDLLIIPIVSFLVVIAVISWLYQKTVEESHHALLETRMQKEAELEQLVAARTQRLEAVAIVSGRLNAILDINQLAKELVDQVKERFDYYHAHIYLLDKERQKLTLNAGYGEAGAEVKAQGHHIPLNAPTSLVAHAARRREIIYVDDVRQASDWLPNPWLPDTHSEMAVPIIAEDEVIGVLDVQSDQVAGLDEGDMDLLCSLANQVAVAMTNAQFYQIEQELRRQEAERAQELAKVNADLKAAQDELLRQERLATLGKLTAIVSHE
ncbi:GAF domain-containing protein, partial [Chloroflexota bacterium]